MEDENVDYSKGYKRAKIYQTMNGQWYFLIIYSDSKQEKL